MRLEVFSTIRGQTNQTGLESFQFSPSAEITGHIFRSSLAVISRISSWDCARRNSKLSCDCTYGYVILEELDYMGNLTRLLVLPHTTSSDKDTSRTQIWIRISQKYKKRKQLSVATTCKTIAILSCFCLSIVPFAIKLVKLILNHLFFLNVQFGPWSFTDLVLYCDH